MRGPRTLQLLIVARRGSPAWESFEYLAQRVMAEDPAIRALVLEDAGARAQWRRLLPLLARPTLVVSPRRLLRLRPWRGTVLQGVRTDKAWELGRLEAAGIPTPRWHLLDGPGATPLPDLGPWVVSKPNRGGRGRDVRIVRSERVRWRERYRARNGVVLQEFVYTGRWPVSYRVSVLCGEPIYAARAEARHDRPPLPNRTAFGHDASGGFPLVATSRGSRWSLCDDDEILSLARRTVSAFPGVPLLGVDVVRDVDTGRLYVLEVNACGKTWHLASRTGRGIQAANGIDFESQFDAYKVAARQLAKETHRLAS